MPVVHAVAEAVAEGGAVAAASFPRPRAVAERLETAAPHFPEAVLIDISLGTATPTISFFSFTTIVTKSKFSKGKYMFL